MSIDVSATFSKEQVKHEGIGVIDMYILNASRAGFEPLYFANWNHNIIGFALNASGDFTTNEEVYTGLPIKREEIKTGLQGEYPGLSISISNVDRGMEAYVQNRNYLRGCEIYSLTSFIKHLPASEEMLANPGFETAGGGGADIWSGWFEEASDGSLVNETGITHGGNDACKITAGASSDSRVRQTISVTAGNSYELTIWSYGDGLVAGAYQIYDLTNTKDITNPTRVVINSSDTSWYKTTFLFKAPTGCEQIYVYLFCPQTGTGYVIFDDISLKQVGNYIGTTPDRFAILKEKLFIDSPSSDENAVSFTCKPKLSIENKILPGRTYSLECAWANKGRYAGTECNPQNQINATRLASYPSCDGSRDNCEERKNLKRFGGFTSTPQKGFVIV